MIYLIGHTVFEKRNWHVTLPTFFIIHRRRNVFYMKTKSRARGEEKPRY